MELPAAFHDELVERLDDYLSGLSNHNDANAIATHIVGLIESIAEDQVTEGDIPDDIAEDLVAKLEASGELEATLVEVLEELFESDPTFVYTPEEVIHHLQRLCEIEWEAHDEEEEVGNMLKGNDGFDEDDF